MNRPDGPLLLLGDGEGDHLRVGVATDAAPPGPGWMAFEVVARGGGLAGRVVGALEPDAIAAFRRDVASLAASPRGRAALVAPDGFFALRLLGDGFGHFDARCELCDHAAIGSRLELTLPVNARDLPALLAALDALASAAAGG